MVERAVLVTRPAEQSGHLCRLVQEAGFKAIAQPMLEIRPLLELPPAQLQRVLDLDLYQHVIVVSSNAVRWGMDWIGRYWPQLPLGISWYAIGAASADKLSTYGVTVKQPETQMNSEGLLALDCLQALEHERVLIIKGQGGRTLLGEVLGERGGRVDELCVYQRLPPTLSGNELSAVLAENEIAAIVITSGEGLHNMLSLLPSSKHDLLHTIPLVVPGNRLAAVAEASGFGAVYPARNATDEVIFEALMQCLMSEESSG